MVRSLLLAAVVLSGLVGCASGGSVSEVQARFSVVPPSGTFPQVVQPAVMVLNRDRQVPMNGLLAVELKLVNTSNEDAIVYNELQPGWLVTIEILRMTGGYYQRSEPMEDVARSRGRGGRYHYVNLPPKGFVGMTYVIQPKDPRWRLEPGRYALRVVYQNKYEPCVASPCFTDEDVLRLGEKAVVPMLTGIAASNVEEFEVVEAE